MRHAAMAAVLLAAAGSAMAGPVATVTSAAQDAAGELSVSYTLANGPAVVLLDVETNSPSGWLPIGGANISGKGYAPDGDVNRIVDGGDGTKMLSISWSPDAAWRGVRIDGANARACVRAFPTNDTPDFLVVDLKATDGGVRYYPDAAALPGGLLSNTAYRVSKLVLKRVRVRNVTWTVGAQRPFLADDVTNGTYGYPEKSVVLEHDFYMGVFEVTQGQFRYVWPDGPVSTDYTSKRLMRPQGNVSYQHVREWPAGVACANPPSDASWLGLLRQLTVSTGFPDGIAFDLPSEAQWEYVARGGAGKDPARWPDGRLLTDTSVVPGWYASNMPSGWTGPCIVGTRPEGANPLGFHDLLGNVWEFCLDTADDGRHVVCGGSFQSTAVRHLYPARCSGNTRSADQRQENTGFRVVCRAGLQ